jgi:molybdenum cofactor cytidylyltransferase
MTITGILLAAGYSRRFGSDKLLQPLADGTPVAITAARKLLVAVDQTLAVVRPESFELADMLHHQGLQIVSCASAQAGMGASIACGIKASLESDAWVIALADMPFIQPITFYRLVSLLQQGADIVAPTYQGQRGHPIGFSQSFGTQLSKLTGDQGARRVLQSHRAQVTLFPSTDAGTRWDIDTPTDLTGF